MRRWHSVVMASVLSAALVGCSQDSDGDKVASLGDDSPSASAPSTSPEPSASASNDVPVAIQLTRCLRREGVDIEDPAGGEINLSTFRSLRLGDAKTFKAMQTCREQLITDGVLDEDAYEIDRDQVLKLAECAREQGIDIDDPTFAPDGSIVPPKNLDELDFGSPEFQRVLAECRQFLPMPGGSN